MELIHKFRQGNDFYVIDVNSGAVHEVDELVYDMLDSDKLIIFIDSLLTFLTMILLLMLRLT